MFFTYPLELIRVRMAFATHKFTGPSDQRPSFLSAMRRIYHEGSQPASSFTSGPGPVSSSSLPVTDQAKTSLFARFPVLKFYRGFTVTTVGMIPYAGTSFLFWGFLRAHFFPHREGGSKTGAGPLADLSIGAVSGALAQTVSYPFEVIRRRMQVGGLTQPDRWMRWGETVKTIWASRGWRGFYVGLTIGYLKVVPMTAVSFAVWQWERRLLDL